MRTATNPVNPQLVFGIFVMVVGVVLGLDSLGIADTGFILRLWPIGLVMLGATVATRAEPHSRFWGFVWIFLGCWLLLRNYGIVRVGFWQLFWPSLLIAWGVSVIRKTLRQTGHLSIENTRAERLFAVMGESKRRLDGKAFEGAYMTAFMGGCVLDLRRATIPPGETKVVEVFGIMVGHQIRVPSEWNVTLDVTPLMGEVKDKRVPPVAPPPLTGFTPPTVVVRGMVVMGELKIDD